MIGPETLRIAWGGITANKLRSGLTILGMTIGVASVIVLIAVGNGSSKAVKSQIQSLGTNVLLVMAGAGRGGIGASSSSTISLTKGDAQALQDPSLAPDVKSASPVVNASSVKLVYGGSSFEPSSFIGTTPSYLTAHSYTVAEGASFTSEDVSKHKRVAVIGQEVVQELFAGSSAVGQNIKVNGSNFEVVGVLAKKGTNGTTNEDDVVMAPISTVQSELTGAGSIDSITVEANSESALDAAEGEVTQVLEERHKIKDTSEPGFSVLNQGSLLSTSRLLQQCLHDAAGRGCRDLAAGRWDRRDEHHARLGHRAHQGDRDPQGDRRQALGHSHPVLDRGGARLPDGWPHGRRRGCARQPVQDRRGATGSRDVLDPARVWRGGAVRPVLRHLSRRSRRRAATDRSAAL